MSVRTFSTLQVLMPTILAHLEMIYPGYFTDATYSIHERGNGLVGLNLHSDKYPSTLFWIDERFDVQPSFGKYTELRYQFDSKLKKKLSDLLKRSV